MEAALGSVAEDTSALSDVVSADSAPWDLGGVGLLENINLLSVDLDAAISLLDGALEASCSF